MLVAQNSLGPVCPVPLTVRGSWEFVFAADANPTNCCCMQSSAAQRCNEIPALANASSLAAWTDLGPKGVMCIVPSAIIPVGSVLWHQIWPLGMHNEPNAFLLATTLVMVRRRCDAPATQNHHPRRSTSGRRAASRSSACPWTRISSRRTTRPRAATSSASSRTRPRTRPSSARRVLRVKHLHVAFCRLR